jgi:hypothetical protein
VNNPIIIGGCGSSGTTLLRKMLNAHPDIACGPEMSVYDRPIIYKIDKTRLYTLWRNQDFDELDKGCLFQIRLPNNISYFGLRYAGNMRHYHQPEQVDKWFKEAADVGSFFNLFFSNFMQKQKKGRWAEKTPNNIFCAKQVLDMYPEAYFINVIRDGRDVVLSLSPRMEVNGFIIAIIRWLTSIEAGRRLMGHERFYTVRYEDLVLQTRPTLEKLCNYIRVDYDQRMLEYWKTTLPEDIQSSDITARYGTQPVFDTSVGKWKKQELNPALIEIMNLAMADKLKELGYEVL